MKKLLTLVIVFTTWIVVGAPSRTLASSGGNASDEDPPSGEEGQPPAEDPGDPEPEDEPPALDESAPVAASAPMSAPTIVADLTVSPVGLGAGTTVGGTTGVLIRRQFNADWGVQGVLGVERASFTSDPGTGETTTTASVFTLGAYAVRRFRTWDPIALSWVGGGEIGFASGAAKVGGATSSSSSTNMTIAGGALVDYFILPRLSLWAQSGVRVSFLGEHSALAALGGNPAGGADGLSATVISIGPSSVASTIGLTWWL